MSLWLMVAAGGSVFLGGDGHCEVVVVAGLQRAGSGGSSGGGC